MDLISKEEVRAFRVLGLWPSCRPGVQQIDHFSLPAWRANRATGPGLRDLGCRQKPNLHLGVEL